MGRFRVVTAVVAILALLVVACADNDDGLTQISLQLQWVAQAQFAGYYAAVDQGFYADEGLNVTILEGAVEIVPQQVVATGGAEFGLAWVPKALVSNEEDAGLVNVGQVFQRSGTLMVSLADSGITSPRDWEGKVVGNWGFGNEYELTAAIEKFEVDVDELVAQSFDMEALLNREIDAAEAMIYNEYAQVLEATNPDTDELYQPSDLGRDRLQRPVDRNCDAPGRHLGWAGVRREQPRHRGSLPAGQLPWMDLLPRRSRQLCGHRAGERTHAGS